MAGNFESGVAAYIKATATVEVYFPVDAKGNADISCNQCKYFRRQSRSCGLNSEICQYPEHYVGGFCILKLEEEKEM